MLSVLETRRHFFLQIIIFNIGSSFINKTFPLTNCCVLVSFWVLNFQSNEPTKKELLFGGGGLVSVTSSKHKKKLSQLHLHFSAYVHLGKSFFLFSFFLLLLLLKKILHAVYSTQKKKESVCIHRIL